LNRKWGRPKKRQRGEGGGKLWGKKEQIRRKKKETSNQKGVRAKRTKVTHGETRALARVQMNWQHSRQGVKWSTKLEKQKRKKGGGKKKEKHVGKKKNP